MNLTTSNARSSLAILLFSFCSSSFALDKKIETEQFTNFCPEGSKQISLFMITSRDSMSNLLNDPSISKKNMGLDEANSFCIKIEKGEITKVFMRTAFFTDSRIDQDNLSQEDMLSKGYQSRQKSVLAVNLKCAKDGCDWKNRSMDIDGKLLRKYKLGNPSYDNIRFQIRPIANDFENVSVKVAFGAQSKNFVDMNLLFIQSYQWGIKTVQSAKCTLPENKYSVTDCVNSSGRTITKSAPYTLK